MFPVEKEKNNGFERIYRSYFSKLKSFALEYVFFEEDAENIVQDVFADLWEKRDMISIHTNQMSFLFISVKNRCLNHLQHIAIHKKYTNKLQEEHLLMFKMNLESLEAFDQRLFSEPDVDAIIDSAINSLPEKCRKIFIMSKIEGKKQKEIAAELQISVSTVESQMSIAYRKLKEELKNHVPLYLFLLFM